MHENVQISSTILSLLLSEKFLKHLSFQMCNLSGVPRTSGQQTGFVAL